MTTTPEQQVADYARTAALAAVDALAPLLATWRAADTAAVQAYTGSHPEWLASDRTELADRADRALTHLSYALQPDAPLDRAPWTEENAR